MEEHLIISDSKKTCLLLKMSGSMDDLYELDAITDQLLMQNTSIWMNETSFNGADCRHSTSKLSPSRSSNGSLGQNIEHAYYANH